MLSTIPSRRHSSAIAYSPRRPDNTIRIFSSAEYRLRVARRISRTCCSAVSDGTDFCLIFAPSRATMSQKSSLRQIPQCVSQLLTGNTRIHGELLKLGFEVAQSTVAKYMPKRRGPPSQGWRTFLRNRIGNITSQAILGGLHQRYVRI